MFVLMPLIINLYCQHFPLALQIVSSFCGREHLCIISTGYTEDPIWYYDPSHKYRVLLELQLLLLEAWYGAV